MARIIKGMTAETAVACILEGKDITEITDLGVMIDIVGAVDEHFKRIGKIIGPMSEKIKESMKDEAMAESFGDRYKSILSLSESAPLIPSKVAKIVGAKKFMEIATVTKKAASECMTKEQLDKCSGPTVTTYKLSFKRR